MRGRWIAVGVVLTALLGLGLFLTLRDNARPVTVEEAKDRTTSSTALDDQPATPRPEPGVYRCFQIGTERSDVWYAVETGLLLRNERTMEVRTDTPIGESTYTESGEFHLVSIDPT